MRIYDDLKSPMKNTKLGKALTSIIWVLIISAVAMAAADNPKAPPELSIPSIYTQRPKLGTCYYLIEWWLWKKPDSTAEAVAREMEEICDTRSDEEVIAMARLIARIKGNEQLKDNLEIQSLEAEGTLQWILKKANWQSRMAELDASERRVELAIKARKERLEPVR